MSQHTPGHHAVVPREIELNFDTGVPCHWLDDDAFKTRFFDAMSTLFPDGERFFIETVRTYRDRIQDPALQQQVKDFIRQEGQHGKLHSDYNQRLKSQGIQIDEIARVTRERLGAKSRLGPKLALAVTCGAEHLTAILGYHFMNNQQLFANADPKMRALYFWHGVEEIEHKAVAFDVYTKVAKGSYGTRILGFFIMTMAFSHGVFNITRTMLQIDGKADWKTWRGGLRWMWGRRGILWPLVPLWLAYLKPGYHPWQMKAPDALAHWYRIFEETGDPIRAAEIAGPTAS